MARNSRVRIVDPLFLIPDEVGDFEYPADPLEQDVEYDYDVEEALTGDFLGYDDELESDVYIVDEGESEYYELPDTPNTITVIDQIIRTGTNGMQVVDLILDVEEVPGAIDYQFRVVKT
jgi:hypothetical protein